MEKVTAVVPARNCRRMLHRCLTALSGTESVSKIIVVDDGSEDGTAEMLRSRWPAVTSLLLPAHTGRVHALNAGLRLVRTEYAFVILPDLQPSKSCVKKLLRALQRENEKISCRRGTEETGENTGFGDGAVFCAVPSFFDGTERAEAPRAADSRKREAASHMTEDAREREAASRTTANAREREAASYATADAREREAASYATADAREREDVFRAADLRKRNSTLRDEIAVPDGCALYHMRILEKTGWLDERLFEGLEAFDLSLRAALYNCRTIRVADAAVRRFRAEKDLSAVRLQITAGNEKYIFYKNLPAGISLSLPVLFAAKAARAAAFRQGDAPEAGRMASERGRILCRLERARRAALAEGVSVWPESLPDAAFLAMDDRNSRIYPLYLAEKEPFLFRRVPQYLRIRRQLARETAQLYRLLTRT